MEPIIIYEDNHLLVVCKRSGEIVQGDKTGDTPLSESLKEWLKVKYNKPGNVFLGVVHRLDRPVGGLVLFAKTTKALSRMNELFRKGEVHKTYWAIVCQRPPHPQERITHHLERNEKQNKSYAYLKPNTRTKEAQLTYRHLASGTHYHLVEVVLHTGRHHQIRAQLSAIGCPIKGDLKYGASRSNRDGSICLYARYLSFVHPVSGQYIHLEAPLPDDPLWQTLGTSL